MNIPGKITPHPAVDRSWTRVDNFFEGGSVVLPLDKKVKGLDNFVENFDLSTEYYKRVVEKSSCPLYYYK